MIAAWPLLPVAAGLPAVRVADGPLPPALEVNDTLTPLTGLPSASLTCTTSGCENACPTVGVWLFPETMAMLLGMPELTGNAVPTAGVNVPSEAVS